MDYEIISRGDQDKSRGVALLLASAVLVLLTWVLPAVAPLAIAAYGIYQIVVKNYAEGLVALGLAVVFWLLRPLVGGLIWIFALGASGVGLFFLIRGLRGSYQTS